VEKNVVALPSLEKLPGSETGLMKLYEAIGIFEKNLPQEPYYRTVIFGSARATEDEPLYKQVQDFAYNLAKEGIDIVTGGGAGFMEAANLGACAGKKFSRSRSYGVKINCYPDEKPNQYLEREYSHGHYATRLHHFARLGRSFVAVEGGIGTALEVLWIMQLLQAKQIDGPLILVGPMWQPMMQWMKLCMWTKGRIKREDLLLPFIFDTMAEAQGVVLKHHELFKQKLAVG